MDVETITGGEVPVVWVEAPGPLIGGLTFRVGQADETLARRGSTHLIEHLALHDLKVRCNYNGSTGLSETTFFARGEEDEVAEVLNHSIRRLADLPWSRLLTEANVLRAEAAGRNPSITGLAMFLRYGPQGPGLIYMKELALERPDPAGLKEWRDQYFTAGNACLWFAGERPVEIDVSPISGGVRMPITNPSPIMPFGRRLYRERLSGVALSYSAPRSSATNLAVGLLAKRLNDVLREELGLVYGVVADLEWRGQIGDGTIMAECIPDNQTRVLERLIVEMTRFAYDGPSKEDREEYMHHIRRSTSDPAGASAFASSAASNILINRPHPTSEAWIADLEACPSTEIAAAVAQILDYSLWLTSHDTAVTDRRFMDIPQWSLTDIAPSGQEFLPVDQSKPGNTQRLIVAADGVKQLFNGPADPLRRVAVPVANLAAMMVFSNGRRVLWSTEGFTLVVDPTEWVNGTTLPGLIDAIVPEHLTVAANEEVHAEESLSLYGSEVTP